ncbi:MAG: YHS domain-containing (seleno)protein [Alphaproteobacteria bacterium]
MTHSMLRTLRRCVALAAVVTGLLAAGPASAGPVWYKGGLFGGVAVKGYDVVAYFTDGKPVEGKSEFSYEWGGTKWQFASAAHRDAFKAMPGKYAPQYGGFCAWAVSQGYTAKIDPDAWKIVEGKLYLNYSKGVQQQWQQDVPGNIAKGDQNWPGIKKDLAAK